MALKTYKAAGEHSKKTGLLLNSVGFNAHSINLLNGRAASIKLLKSIFIDCLEALT
jgi:alpha-glucuronidase